MKREEIADRIKGIIASVAGLERDAIMESSSLRDELGIDSLSRIEIGVDVDYAFKLKLPDESYQEVDSVEAMVALVERRLAEMAPVAQTA